MMDNVESQSVLEVATWMKPWAVPDLSFQPDTALDYAMEINRLMHEPVVARDLAASEPDPG